MTASREVKNTILDVAKSAGVSPATVSRVFNNGPYVKDKVRKRVLSIARSMNYAPKSTKAQNAFGILVHGEKYLGIGVYETQLIIGISGEFFKHGYTTEITTDQQTPRFHRNTFRAIIALTSVNSDILDIGIPVVLVNNIMEGVHSVVTDHFQGIELATEHLIAAGHKKIAFISGATRSWGYIERLRGYRETLKRHNIKYNENLHQDAEASEFIEIMPKLLKQNPTAVILSGEGRAQHLAYVLYKLGKKIPDEISVITFEDRDTSLCLIPPHTTISQNIPNIAKAVVGMAVDIVKNKSNKSIQNVVLENSLIVRESVKSI